MRPHRNLEAWRLAMELCGEVYELCAALSPDERYGLASQLKRAAVSVPSNIAEGAARGTKKEFVQFLSIAQGSLAELDTQLELCAGHLGLLGRTAAQSAMDKADRVGMMITGLQKSLRRKT